MRRAAEVTYRDLVGEGHEVDCFVVGDPRVVDEFGPHDRTQLCVVDDGFRPEHWEARAPTVARAAQLAMARLAATRLRALVTRAHRRRPYDAFVQPRWDR